MKYLPQLLIGIGMLFTFWGGFLAFKRQMDFRNSNSKISEDHKNLLEDYKNLTESNISLTRENRELIRSNVKITEINSNLLLKNEAETSIIKDLNKDIRTNTRKIQYPIVDNLDISMVFNLSSDDLIKVLFDNGDLNKEEELDKKNSKNKNLKELVREKIALDIQRRSKNDADFKNPEELLDDDYRKSLYEEEKLFLKLNELLLNALDEKSVYMRFDVWESTSGKIVKQLDYDGIVKSRESDSLYIESLYESDHDPNNLVHERIVLKSVDNWENFILRYSNIDFKTDSNYGVTSFLDLDLSDMILNIQGLHNLRKLKIDYFRINTKSRVIIDLDGKTLENEGDGYFRAKNIRFGVFDS